MPQMWQRIAGEETWLNIFDYDSLNVLAVRDIPFEILPFLWEWRVFFLLFCWNLKLKLRYSVKTRWTSAQGGQQCCSHTPYEFAAEHCLGYSPHRCLQGGAPEDEFSPGVILQIYF